MPSTRRLPLTLGAWSFFGAWFLVLSPQATVFPLSTTNQLKKPSKNLHYTNQVQSNHTMSRTGKIARLPRPIREELNVLLERSTPGRLLAAWLNSLPEVQELLRDFFDNKPVNEQNLSEWRRGGFAEWQTRNDLLDRAGDASLDAEKLEAAVGPMAHHAAQFLSARYAVALANWNGDPQATEFAGLKHLSPLVRDVSALRRHDIANARLQMEQYAFHLACQDKAPPLSNSEADEIRHPVAPVAPPEVTPFHPVSTTAESGCPNRESNQIKPNKACHFLDPAANHTAIPNPARHRAILRPMPRIDQPDFQPFPRATRARCKTA
jgi:hypothetical protein